MPAEELRVELLRAREVRDGDFDGEEAANGGLVFLLIGVILSSYVGVMRVTGAVMVAYSTVIVLIVKKVL